MEKLKKLLPGVPDSSIEGYLKNKGLSLENLSDEELQAIASDFSKISTTQSAKVSKSGKRGKVKTPANLPQAIAKVGQQTEAEINSLVDAVEEGVEHFAQSQSDRLLNVISDAPNRMMNYFVEKAEAYEGDPEGFRQRGQEIVGGIFAGFSANTAK